MIKACMVILIFPLLASSKRYKLRSREKRMFATTTSWLMVKTQLVIRLSIGVVMRLVIRNHAQRSVSNNKVRKHSEAKPISKQVKP